MYQIFLSPQFAREMVGIYDFYQRSISPDVAAKATFERYLLLLGQYIDEIKNKTVAEVVQYLRGLAATEELDKSALPPISQELLNSYEDWKKLASKPTRTTEDIARLQALRIKLEKDAEIIKQRLSAPIYQAPVVQEIAPKPKPGLEDWIAHSRTERFNRTLMRALKESGLEENTAAQTTQNVQEKISQNPEIYIHQDPLQKLISDAIQQVRGTTPQAQQIATQVAESVLPAITQASVQESKLFDIEQPIELPQYRVGGGDLAPPESAPEPTPPSTPSRKAQEERLLYYLRFRREPEWKKIVGQVVSVFGFTKDTQKSNLEVFEEAVRRAQVINPRFLEENKLLIDTLSQSLPGVVGSGVKISEISFVPGQDLQAATRRLDRQFEQIVAVQINAQDKSIQAQPLTEKPETKAISPAISQFAGQKAKTWRQDLASWGAIKLKQLLTSPNLAWLRIPLAGALGLGGLTLPIAAPLKILMLGGSGILGMSQIVSQPPSIPSISLPFLGGFGGGGGGTPGRGIFPGFSLGKVSASSNVALYVVGGILAFAIFILIPYDSISKQQGIFLKEGTSAGEIPESKYIGLTKTVNVSSYKGSLPKQFDYSVTISAKEADLTDIKITDQYSVFSKTTPPAPQSTLTPNFNSLKAGESQTLSYPITLGPEYNDSVVSNNLTVTANVKDGPSGEKTTRSAAITIGNPPLECFTFSGNWNEDEKARVIDKIGKLSKSSAYILKICSGRTVYLVRGGDPGYGGEVTGGNTIHLYSRAFSRGDATLFYTIAHESGHIYGHRDPNAYKAFSVNVYGEPYIPTYTLQNSPDEDFAENIGVYIIRHEVPVLSGYDISNMATAWPKHYNFAKQKVFEGFDGF